MCSTGALLLTSDCAWIATRGRGFAKVSIHLGEKPVLHASARAPARAQNVLYLSQKCELTFSSSPSSLSLPVEHKLSSVQGSNNAKLLCVAAGQLALSLAASSIASTALYLASGALQLLACGCNIFASRCSLQSTSHRLYGRLTTRVGLSVVTDWDVVPLCITPTRRHSPCCKLVTAALIALEAQLWLALLRLPCA